MLEGEVELEVDPFDRVKAVDVTLVVAEVVEVVEPRFLGPQTLTQSRPRRVQCSQGSLLLE
jgi:hypothetical protein